MLGPPRLARRNAQIVRSQFAVEVLLSILALAGACLTLRLIFKLLSISDRVWAGNVIYGVTDPLIWPLTVLPGSGRQLLGQATLTEFTVVVIVLMIPLGLIARDQPQRGR